MLDEPVPDRRAEIPNYSVEDASLAVEARIARIVGAGSFGFWTTFATICLSAIALLILALMKG